MNVSIETGGISPLLGVFIALCFLVVFYLYYRRTIPPKGRFLRGFLFFVRSFVLLLIVLCLMEPTVSLGIRRRLRPVLAVLLDGSASMGMEEDGTTRGERALQIWSSETLRDWFKEGRAQGYVFSTNAARIEPVGALELPFDGIATDLSGALTTVHEDFKNINLTGVLLLTDGASNLGGDPLKMLDRDVRPIYAIGIGEVTPLPDVRIERMDSSPVAYTDTETVVEVSLRAERISDFPISVVLKEGSRVLDEKTVTFTGEAPEQSVILSFKPVAEGLYHYEVEAVSGLRESTLENNKRSLTIRIFKRGISVLLCAGRPSHDLQFLIRNLMRNPDVKLQTLVLRDEEAFMSGSFPESLGEMESLDVLIILDMPGHFFEGQRGLIVEEFVRRDGGGLMLLGSRVLEGDKNVLDAILPVVLTVGEEGTYHGGFVPEVTRPGLNHFITNLTQSNSETEALFRRLPPLSSQRLVEEVRPNCTGLLVHPQLKTSGTGMPTLAVSRAGNGKVVLGLFSSFWRWDFMMTESSGGKEVLGSLLSNAVRWLATGETSFMFSLKIDKKNYLGGETVNVSARLFDEVYLSDPGQEIRLSLIGPDTSRIVMRDVGEGWYRSAFHGLSAGKYTLRAAARPGRPDSLGAEAIFTVDEFSLEHLNSALNEDLLMRLAEGSRGSYASFEDAGELLASLRFSDTFSVVDYEVKFWNRPFTLILIIVFFCGEWIIRKRTGML